MVIPNYGLLRDRYNVSLMQYIFYGCKVLDVSAVFEHLENDDLKDESRKDQRRVTKNSLGFFVTTFIYVQMMQMQCNWVKSKQLNVVKLQGIAITGSLTDFIEATLM